jgi:ElaB/YqjD/DUF883 family membrane-anchored ribosome-binding protein
METPSLEDVTKVLKDVLYVYVGIGVLTYQKAQEQTKALRERLSDQAKAGRNGFETITKNIETMAKTAEGQFKAFEERLGAIEERIDGMLDGVQAQLPDPAADLLKQARTAAKTAREQVKNIVSRGQGATAEAAA